MSKTPSIGSIVGIDPAAATVPWASILVPLHHCPKCNALFKDVLCPVCGHALDMSPTEIEIGGERHIIPAALQGAIPWSTYALIDQMRIEWLRPVSAEENQAGRPAGHFVIIVLFWTLFEVLMHGFYRSALADLPGELGDELLRTSRSISARAERLHRRRWGVTLWQDFADLGFSAVAEHLQRLQRARNAFVHGNPTAIDKALVQDTVGLLTDIQIAWVKLFNERCTGMSRRVQLWQDKY